MFSVQIASQNNQVKHNLYELLWTGSAPEMKKKIIRLSTATYLNWLHVCTDLLYHWGLRFDKNNFRRHLSTCDKTLYLRESFCLFS